VRHLSYWNERYAFTIARGWLPTRMKEKVAFARRLIEHIFGHSIDSFLIIMPTINDTFDVFLSHNSDEKRFAKELGIRLCECGLRVWLDAWELRPGLSWQDGLLEGLSASRSCAVLIGKSGYGGWHKKEMEVALLQQRPEYPVIPVLLPGAPDRAEIGAFLSLLTWVDCRLGLNDSEAIERLIWGITGLRPDQGVVADKARADPKSRPGRAKGRFVIQSPRNGDLLFGWTKFSGTGPPNERVFLQFRSPTQNLRSTWPVEPSPRLASAGPLSRYVLWRDLRPAGPVGPSPGLASAGFRLVAESETNGAGQWVMEIREQEPGPYEIIAAGIKVRRPSQVVTVYYGDTSNIKRVSDTIRPKAEKVEIFYQLHAAFIETTKLKRGRPLFSGKLTGLLDEIESLAARAGDEIAARLKRLVTNEKLTVNISIDELRRVRISPDTAWACYYAFPDPWYLGSDILSLRGMVSGQVAWRLMPHVGQIPSKPFGDRREATNTYLEIRHDGYRPEFVALANTWPQSAEVELLPVLHKRIAVLDFPSINSDLKVSSFFPTDCKRNGRSDRAPGGACIFRILL